MDIALGILDLVNDQVFSNDLSKQRSQGTIIFVCITHSGY
ncbi:18450_t:CDS:2 [Racocetra fulgida]|uniref:18450_t:CDS:1 n=1 Tax=Racocetra fulgida TaxID=60492 RepID=A0A9N9F8W4_9GLOM|nr:18450_t:CDS:2 [Racocetra fulgida]